MNTPALAIDTVFKVAELFKKKSWPVESFGDQRKSPYQRFCELLARLSTEEQSLLLTLSEDFLRCAYPNYPDLLTQALQKVDLSNRPVGETIFLVPLVAPKDHGKAKSATQLIYPAKHLCVPEISSFKPFHVKAVDSMYTPKAFSKPQASRTFIFLDDFIGTGQTALEALQYFDSNIRHTNDWVVVVSLVAQTSGIQAVQNAGYAIEAAQTIGRGISDSARFSDTNTALKTMDKIEDRIKIPANYRRGYNQSEALVSMIRTPNNTFPLYWAAKGVDELDWPAPFPR